MCGRFTMTIDPGDLQVEWGIGETPSEWIPRYNIAPTQPVAVLRDPLYKLIEYFQWGLVPYWAKEESIGGRMINARSETLREKPSFRQAFSKRRCLILADGFYEWQKQPDKKPSIPYYFQLADKRPFAFAGLWETWVKPDASILHSCTIITTSANELVGKVHERMPVILTAQNGWQWVEQHPEEELEKMLLPYPAELMTARAVSVAVNSPSYDDIKCIKPGE